MTKQMPMDTLRRRSLGLKYLLLLLFMLLIVILLFLPLQADAMDPSVEEHVDTTTTTKETVAQQRRNKQAKMWYLRRIEVGNTKLPFSAVTLAIVFFSIYYLISDWSGASGGGGRGNSGVFCEASHILIADHSEAGQKTLMEYQEKIKDDAALFAKYAQKYSACPSKNNGGNLGKFPPGAMLPPFDRTCFAPDTPMNTTVGPVQTSFGWHLIYIHSRQLPEQK